MADAPTQVSRPASSRAGVTRFAPSPTGYLHLGHVASAAYVFGMGRRLGRAVVLRIEDHDRGRSRPEYERAIFEDLAWLGLLHDNIELAPGKPSRYRQSDNAAAYAAAVETLRVSHQVYACDCTRKQIAAGAADTDELLYGGRCRDRGLPLDAPDTGLRVLVPDVSVTFHDLLLGPRSQTPKAQCGDLLLRDRHGQWTYQFAVAVDDLEQDVDLVIRGQDLTESTGRQVLLGRWLGRRADARFAHHPLLVDPQGQKLGKRFFSEAVAKRRAAGEDAETVLGDAVHAAGLTPHPGRISARDLPSLFPVDLLAKDA